jgi:hypothetical protein
LRSMTGKAPAERSWDALALALSPRGEIYETL